MVVRQKKRAPRLQGGSVVDGAYQLESLSPREHGSVVEKAGFVFGDDEEVFACEEALEAGNQSGVAAAVRMPP